MSNRTLNAFMNLFIQLHNAKMDMTPLFKLGKGLNKDCLYHNIIPHIIDMKNKEYTKVIFNMCLHQIIYTSDIIAYMNAMYEGFEGVAIFNMFLLNNNHIIKQYDLDDLQNEISDGNIIEYDGLLHYIYQCGLKVDEEDDEFVKKHLNRWFI